MSAIKKIMPLLARHEGVWEGVYRYYDAKGGKIDEHQSRLLCRFPDADEYEYHQTNYYTWEDGRTEERDFPAKLRDERIWFSGEIEGWAAELPLDDKNRTLVLHWQRADMPGTYLYELIHISDCGRYRSRMWQGIKDGKTLRRTLIDETKVSDDWRSQ